MSSDRHYRSSGNRFICFSAMKISSKSILSPSRAREPPQISLSTSLSRRLKSSGSLKNGQASPMFPTGTKKRGCAFDNPEPSSPKVTCIGQVRVKTKKQGKKIRARSLKRRSNKSEASFRKSEMNLLRQSSTNGGGGHGNQRWVHLPFTICEALRAFGAELNCFLPCNSSCGKGEKPAERAAEGGGSCVFARWLVAVQENDAGPEIEVVVGDEAEAARTEAARTEDERQRRHVFEGLDFKEGNEEQSNESRISICVPPKNALLLMRCRSDPVKMAELAKRFCESPKVDEDEDREGNESKIDSPLIVTVIEEEDEDEEERKTEQDVELENEEEMAEESVSDVEEVVEEEEANWVLQEEEPTEMVTENDIVEMKLDITEENQEQEKEYKEQEEDQESLVEVTMVIPTPIPILNPTHFEAVIVQDAEKLEESAIEHESNQPHGNEQDQYIEENEDQQTELDEDEDQRTELDENENGEIPKSESLPEVTGHVVLEEDAKTEIDLKLEEEEDEEQENRGRRSTHEEDEVKETTAKATDDEETGPETRNDDKLGQEEYQSTERGAPPAPEPEREPETQTEANPESSILPDCLLLMMYEPKLSMEVSKETWVCSTDFIRCVPAREKKAAPPQPPKKREAKPAAVVQPGRWSCSFPAAAAAAAMIEQKLVRAKGGGGYEPFSLTRCKSEPVRSSAKLAPDACFWKDRKLEPHRSANFGVGAAGIGF